MTEETEIYDRRTDHGKRAALMRLRLAEEKAVCFLGLRYYGEGIPSTDALDVANELSAAIDGVVNYLRKTGGV